MLEKKMDLSSADMEMRDGYPRYHRPLNYLVGNMRKAGLLEQGAGDNSLRISAAGLLLIGK